MAISPKARFIISYEMTTRVRSSMFGNNLPRSTSVIKYACHGSKTGIPPFISTAFVVVGRVECLRVTGVMLIIQKYKTSLNALVFIIDRLS